MKIDFHIHSTFSDGENTLTELIKRAGEEQYEIIAVTDHDTFFNEQYEMVKRECKIRFIRGMEISACYKLPNGKKREIHVLALGFKNHEMINSFVERKNAFEENRIYINAIKTKMEANGVTAPSYDELKAENADSEVIGRVHFARWLKSHSIVKSVDEAFDKYLGEKGIAYQDWIEFCSYPMLEDVVNVIIAADGVPVLAHPLSYGFDKIELECLIRMFKRALNGNKGAIEVFYSKYSEEKQRELLDLVYAYDLLASAGSDYHKKTDYMLREKIDDARLEELISLLI